MKMVKMKCVLCGKQFMATNKNTMYCSHKCRQNAEYKSRTRHTLTCKQCGKHFEALNPKQKFCSMKCWRVHWSIVKSNKFNDPTQARRIAEIRSAVGKCEGLTAEQMAAVIYAQDKAPPSECWELSQKWTIAQRKFAEWRYNEMHGLYKGYHF